jgi:hypothetical protein
MFSVFGVSLFALAALKNLLLFITYFGMFHMSRPMIGMSGAIAASASLILFPSIGWESHVDRTHSVCSLVWPAPRCGATSRCCGIRAFVVVPGLAQAAVFKRILYVTGLAAATILLALPVRIHLGSALGKHTRVHHPYPQLSAQLARQFPQADALIAGDQLEAGNLYFQRPTLRTLTLDEVLDGPERLEGEVLVVTRAGTQAGWLTRFCTVYPLSTVRQ